MGSREEAEADAGWPELVTFLSAAGLKDAPLERALTLLAAEDVTNLAFLRSCFSTLAPQLKIGTRTQIGDALAATPSVGGPHQPRAQQQSAPLPPVVLEDDRDRTSAARERRLCSPSRDAARRRKGGRFVPLRPGLLRRFTRDRLRPGSTARRTRERPALCMCVCGSSNRRDGRRSFGQN